MIPPLSENQHGKPTRRTFIKAGALSICVLPAHAATADPAGEPTVMPPLDYGLSFICHTAPFNSVRFWVESRTRILDERAGTWTDFYQCGACKSENTFAERDLFMVDNYDFLPIFGGDDVLVFRRPACISEKYRTVKKAADMWGAPSLKLKEASRHEELGTWGAIACATADAIPLVSHTEISAAETQLRAIIECPVKTMNIQPEKEQYQVDTGPIAFPDLTRRDVPPIDTLSLAFVAFNAPDFADFVIERPTLVTGDNGATHQVYHYSNPISMSAKNRLFAVHRG
ncbi:MAG TPA: hypothetical protein PLL36_01665 [Candidatus Hydrogenedentes bacterium]|jgi:hypothetical protein|nr:MAG: hypothetical protein BWX80_00544 [Candidatus Hydrogenedentes bacterium ADurb.Bin101]HOC70038.1 hypothetical protein [Candidatus Hydrogenedentota bacterium]HQM99748.1 hypothetical protein [Candidatus Hydrogenedentota bacterium]